MKIDIENIAEEEGRKITKEIMKKHKEYPYLLGKTKYAKKNLFSGFTKGWNEARETKKIKKEICERSLHEATAFFLNHGDAKFDNKIIEILQFRLKAGLRNFKVVRKLKPEEMLGIVIEIHVIDFLLEQDVVVI